MHEDLSTFRLKWGPLGIAFRLLEAGRTMNKDAQVESLVIGSKMNGNVLPRSARRGIGDGGTYGYLWLRSLRVQLRLLALSGLGGRLRVEIELHLGGPVIIILRHKNHVVFPQILRGELP